MIGAARRMRLALTVDSGWPRPAFEAEPLAAVGPPRLPRSPGRYCLIAGIV